MERTLKALQRLQTDAFKNGIHSFNICGWNQKVDDYDIRVIYVTIFREQETDADSNYFAREFREGFSDHDAFINDVKAFINM